jgi:chemotaxis protein MotA
MTTFRKPNLATLAGTGIAVIGILGGLWIEGLSLYEVAQPTAALVVFLGTAGAALISVPISQIRLALGASQVMLFDSCEDPRRLVDEFLEWSRMARSRGVASLEREAGQIGDPVLRKGIRLAADAVGEAGIRSALGLEIRGIEAEAESAAHVYETAAGYAPTLGIVGAAIGLMQVMKHLEHIEQVGAGVAAAFVATIYGVLLANLVLLPVATRIRSQCIQRVRTCEVITEGVVSVAAGLNPMLLRLNLETLLQIPEPGIPAGTMPMPTPATQKA